MARRPGAGAQLLPLIWLLSALCSCATSSPAHEEALIGWGGEAYEPSEVFGAPISSTVVSWRPRVFL